MSRRNRKRTYWIRPPLPEAQANGEPGDEREIEERRREASAEERRAVEERRYAEPRPCPSELPESAMGGTSDAGTAADEAAEAANFGIGTEHDLTKGEG